MTQQELLKKALDFLDRTDIKGSEAEDMTLVRQWLKRLQNTALAASLTPPPAPAVPVAPPAPAAQVAGTPAK